MSMKNGAPGGCPTSSFQALEINSPQSQNEAVGSIVRRYVAAATAKTIHPQSVFHNLNCFILLLFLCFRPFLGKIGCKGTTKSGKRKVKRRKSAYIRTFFEIMYARTCTYGKVFVPLRAFSKNILKHKYNTMINVGIIGCGFVGGALKNWLEHNNPECKLFISDPYKGYNDDLSDIDIAFLQIHVPTEEDGTQDLTLMKELIQKLPDVPVFVRTTILPGTSAMLTKETGHQVYYMPEFLTERTFIEDFNKQTMVFTGAQALLTKIFVGKKFTVMSPLEAELTKYMHNVFGAYKVTYFNACREYCEQMGADWRKVHTGILLSGYMSRDPMVNSAMAENVSQKM